MRTSESIRGQLAVKFKVSFPHPDCDAQFRYINERAREYIGSGDPVTR